MIKVTDLLTLEDVVVDDSKKKMTDFNNAEGVIYWTAPENDSSEEHWVDFKTKGRVENVEDKLSTYNNIVRVNYAKAVKFNSIENDPNRKIWNKFVEYTKQHQSELFDKNGDWNNDATISINVKEFFD